jgi:hypothetical protein
MSFRPLSVVAALVGGTIPLAAPTHAAVVNLDLSAIGLAGVNAGLTPSTGFKQTTTIVPGTSGTFDVFFIPGVLLGLQGTNTTLAQIAVTGGNATPRNFAGTSSVDASASWSGANGLFREPSSISPNFNADNFMGFRIANGADWNYGYFEVTWDGTNFEFLSGAYESTVNVAIMTPSGGGIGVPLPGAAGLAACGLLAAGRRRRR